MQGDGCVAADLTGDGSPDVVVTTTSGVDILWNRGNGTFTRSTLWPIGWYTGAAVADVNGDGRPDIFVAGYADLNEPVPNSYAGFPTNVAGVRDLLFLNEGHGSFREVGRQAGLEAADFSHGLGAMFTDVNGDGRPDLYVANDEDPNQLYVNVAWPGGAAADPEHLGFRFEERGRVAGVADPFAGMGIATLDGGLFVTNSRGEPSAAYRPTAAGRFANARPSFDPALGSGFAGWGASWVDLTNSGKPDLVVTAGAIPVTSLAADAEPVRVLAPAGGSTFGDASSVLSSPIVLNGRGLAAADADNDGRMEIAVNTIGGRLVLLRASGPSGHWLDVGLSRFTPGAVVTVQLRDGRRLERSVLAGSSYLSSEDPRVHFGLGKAASVRRVTVRYPWGAESTLTGVHGDRIVTVAVPAQPRPAGPRAGSALAGCTPNTRGLSAARLWDETAVAVLRAGDASEPVQARDLYDLSAAVWRAYAAERTTAARNEAIAYAAYRLLLSQASYDANLDQTFGLLARQLRALCLSPGFTDTTGRTAAAAGNRIAAAAIAAGAHDGSNEELHYADPTYTPENSPLIVAQPGSTVHDATFWQPLALAQVTPRGGSPVPSQVQTFVASQWGRVRTFAGPRIGVGRPPLGDPSGKAYKAAAIAVIRATSGTRPPRPLDTSPAGWNDVAASLPSRGLERDARLQLALNGALNDAAVAAWGAKRRYQSPRPISMIRYLAFNSQLPVVDGLTRFNGQDTFVRFDGRWVSGSSWSARARTPASPGWVSGDSAFAYAASTVLNALGGRSFAARAAQASRLGVAEGIELPADAAAGRRLGVEAGKRALRRVP